MFFNRLAQPLIKRCAPFIIFACCFVGLSACGQTPKAAETGSISADMPATHATAAAKGMGRGINLGNMFDSPNAKGEWGVPVHPTTDFVRYVDLAAEAGFKHIRVPVRWSSHASLDAAAIIKPEFALRVDAVVDRALARGLYVVLDMHHYRQLDGDQLDPDEPKVDDAVVQLRFFNMWRQISKRYAGRSDKLLFEIYNEPHGKLNAIWNDFFPQALKIIRADNPTRVVVVGPVNWNNSEALPGLELPNDDNILVTFHSYEPFSFTHQGADWVNPRLPTGVECCNDAQEVRVLRSLEAAESWGKQNKRPMYMGEFGAYSEAPEKSRIAYTTIVRQAAEAKGIPWSYWELASGFGVYDPVANTWRKPLLESLIPSK
jgi:endoglucanase